MKRGTTLAAAFALAALTTSVIAPAPAAAQLDKLIHHRQQTKNTWRNVGIGSGALALYGLVSHNGTLALAGTAGALYSASRYEHDRKSQSGMERARASFYGRHTYYHRGHRYVRKTIYRHGHRYYQFVRG